MGITVSQFFLSRLSKSQRRFSRQRAAGFILTATASIILMEIFKQAHADEHLDPVDWELARDAIAVESIELDEKPDTLQDDDAPAQAQTIADEKPMDYDPFADPDYDPDYDPQLNLEENQTASNKNVLEDLQLKDKSVQKAERGPSQESHYGDKVQDDALVEDTGGGESSSTTSIVVPVVLGTVAAGGAAAFAFGGGSGGSDNNESAASDESSNATTVAAAPTQATISGQVRDDVDGDGEFLDLDTGIQGVTVALYQDLDNDGNIDGPAVATAVTDGNGFYNFSDVDAGRYIVTEVDPDGYFSTADRDGDDPNQIWVSASGTVDSVDFLDTLNPQAYSARIETDLVSVNNEVVVQHQAFVANNIGNSSYNWTIENINDSEIPGTYASTTLDKVTLANLPLTEADYQYTADVAITDGTTFQTATASATTSATVDAISLAGQAGDGVDGTPERVGGVNFAKDFVANTGDEDINQVIDLNVSVEFTEFNGNFSDVSMWLTAPDGTQVTLFDVGGVQFVNPQNPTPTVNLEFDDEAQHQIINSGAQPVAGGESFKPLETLSDFDLTNMPEGDWTLHVESQQQVVIESWNLDITDIDLV